MSVVFRLNERPINAEKRGRPFFVRAKARPLTRGRGDPPLTPPGSNPVWLLVCSMIYIHIYIRQCEYDVGAGDRLRVVACRRRCSPSPLPPRSRTRSAQPGRPPSTRQGRRPPPNRHSPPRPPRQRRRGRGQLVRCRGGQLVPCRGFGWWRCLRGQRQRSRRPPWRRLEAASSSTRGSGGVVPNGPMAQRPNGPMAQWPGPSR